jgi:hypothetical protein
VKKECADFTCGNVRTGEPYDRKRDCPKCWAATHHEAVAKSLGRTAVPVKKPGPRPPCAYLGDYTGGTVLCESCGGNVRIKLRRCDVYGKCTEAKKVGKLPCCSGCPSYETPAEGEIDAHPFEPRPDDPACGVVVGAYKWPALADLQIRLIRHTCGPVPILVSNDDMSRCGEFRAVCAAHEDVTYSPNPGRIGHTGGDVACFYKAVLWGRGRNLPAVAKLSHRFLITKSRWLQDVTRDLLLSGLPAAGRRCDDGRFPLRTEAVVMAVDQWDRPGVLSSLLPRKYWNDIPGGGRDAETLVYDVIRTKLGGVFWPWTLVGENRWEKSKDVIWHHTHKRSDYKMAAARFGVSLPQDFHTDGWQSDADRGEYDFG